LHSQINEHEQRYGKISAALGEKMLPVDPEARYN
jgi:hypothetical protein